MSSSSIDYCRRQFLKHKYAFLLLVPGALFFIVFHYVPMTGAVIAFKDYRMSEGILASPWNGLENFEKLFLGRNFLNALRNTLTISLLRLAFGFVAPIILALLLNEIRISWYKRTIQTLTYLPFFFSWVILGGIFLMLFPVDGPINSIVRALDGQTIPFMTSDTWFVFVLIATGIWNSAGYGAIIYLAALSGIDPALYEAAYVDGAGRWKQTLHITLPCLVPTIITLFILSLGGILNAGFDQIYNMYNPLVYDVSDILDTWILRRLQSLDFGLATAAGIFKSAVGMTLIIAANSLAKRLSGGEQGVW